MEKYASGEGIPRILHRIWIDRDREDAPIPSKYKWHTENILELNPEWLILEWNSRQIKHLMENDKTMSKYLPLYRRLKRPVMKADVARLVVLWCYGGIYMDLDFICRRPLVQLLQNYPNEILLVPTPDCSLTSGSICNGFLASVPKHPLWLIYLDEIEKRSKNCNDGYDVLNITGPAVLYEAARKWSSEWEKYAIPWYMILPTDGNGQLVKEMKQKMRDIENEVHRGIMSPSEVFALHDGPYVQTMWEDGTRWADEIWKEIIVNFISGYGAVVLSSIIVLLIFAYFESTWAVK